MKPRACVGVLVIDSEDRILLVKRTNPPRRGSWTLPGGGIEYGENFERAAMRELEEETGLVADAVRVLGVHEHIDDESHLVVVVLEASAAGEVRAGDDAELASWFPLDGLLHMDITEELIRSAIRFRR